MVTSCQRWCFNRKPCETTPFHRQFRFPRHLSSLSIRRRRWLRRALYSFDELCTKARVHAPCHTKHLMPFACFLQKFSYIHLQSLRHITSRVLLFSIDSHLKVQMISCTSPGGAHLGNDRSCIHCLPFEDEYFGTMAVQSDGLSTLIRTTFSRTELPCIQ